jgi:hypothetical protein
MRPASPAIACADWKPSGNFVTSRNMALMRQPCPAKTSATWPPNPPVMPNTNTVFMVCSFKQAGKLVSAWLFGYVY